MIGYPCLVSRFLRLARPEMKLTSEAEYVGDVESEPRGFDLTSKITVLSGTSHHRLLAGTSSPIRFGTYNYDGIRIGGDEVLLRHEGLKPIAGKCSATQEFSDSFGRMHQWIKARISDGAA